MSTTHDEGIPDIKVDKISAPVSGVYALRAYQLLNGSPEEVRKMLMDYELGKTVREHFNKSNTQMLLRRDIEVLLKED